MKYDLVRTIPDHEITFGRGFERATVTVCTDDDYQYAFISDIGADTPDEERDGIDWLTILPTKYSVHRVTEGSYEIKDDGNRRVCGTPFEGNYRTAAFVCWQMNRSGIARLRKGLKDGSIRCDPDAGLIGF